jgi:hypothetical protein
MTSLFRHPCACALVLAVLAGCNDQTNKGAGTGGYGAGSAEGASGVSSPIGGASGTQGDGATVSGGSGTTNSTLANPGSTDAASPSNSGNLAK